MSSDLATVLRTRHSCRAFRREGVPDATIRGIVADARHAPSWCNAQPWQLTVTRDGETDRFRAMLQQAMASGAPNPDMPWPESYPGAHGARRRACGYQLYEAAGIARDDREARTAQSLRNFDLFDAPHVAIVSSEAALGPYGALDCGGFVMALLLAAEARGVATIAQASVSAYPDAIRAHFGLPDTRLILCAVSFGFADRDHTANSFRTERAEVDDMLDIRH